MLPSKWHATSLPGTLHLPAYYLLSQSWYKSKCGGVGVRPLQWPGTLHEYTARSALDREKAGEALCMPIHNKYLFIFIEVRTVQNAGLLYNSMTY
jgi:hypothetical protein